MLLRPRKMKGRPVCPITDQGVLPHNAWKFAFGYSVLPGPPPFDTPAAEIEALAAMVRRPRL
jgi:hypothetical protein